MVLAAASTPLWADQTARPGTVNYVEGQAATGGQSLDSKSAGVEIGAGQSVTTLNGKVEILLTPGVFLRLGPNSSATLVSTGLADTRVDLTQGQAMVEVDQLFPQNHLQITQGGFAIQIQKAGLYDFDPADQQVRVFDGEAVATNAAHRIEMKAGHELNLVANSDLKAHGFDRKHYEGDLFNWSKLRSSYLAEANITEARTYVSGPGFIGAGWYWNPWYSAYTFIPGDGFFYDPFGWGFYSPFLVWRAPLVGFYGGFYGGGYHHFAGYTPSAAFVAANHGVGVSGYRSGTVVAAHAGVAPAFHSMGGGGFHGGRR
jgi:hypothetical protein